MRSRTGWSRARSSGLLLAAVVLWLNAPSVVWAGGQAADAAHRSFRLQQTTSQILDLRVRRDHACHGPVPRLGAERCSALERELAAAEEAAWPPEGLTDLAAAPPQVVEEVARLAYALDRRDAVPALRRAVAELGPGRERQTVRHALCALGDETHVEPTHGEERAALVERFLAAPDFDLWLRLSDVCGGAELARRAPRSARLIVDVRVAPLSRIFYRGDLRLHAGERVKVLLDGDPDHGTAGQVLVSVRGETAWLDTRLLVEGTPPPTEELRRRVAQALATGEHRRLLRPLQILLHLHGAKPGSLPLDPAVTALLARLPEVETLGADGHQVRRRVERLRVGQVVGDATQEVRAELRIGHSEGWDRALELYYGLAGPGAPHRFVVTTQANTLEGTFRRFAHLVDLDADADLEIVVLEGTLSLPTPQDNARTWKLRSYDFDGSRFVPVAWTPRLEHFLHRRLEDSRDPLERTILRSHFGMRGDGGR